MTTVALDTVVSREAAWFTAEPPATFLTAPPLNVSAGGPFSVVQGYLDKTIQRQTALYIERERTVETRLAFGGVKEWVHQMLITVLWPFDNAAGNLPAEMQNLDTAVAAVVTRIRDVLGDKTHGGAFTVVGEGLGADERIDIQWMPPRVSLSNREPLEVQIRYTASDTVENE